MDTGKMKTLAAQLRKPHGERGKDVAQKMNQGNLLMNKYTIDLLDAKTAEYILEIGMGNGFFVKYILLNDPTIKYSGCDFSETMVREAEIHNKQFIKSRQAQFHVADAASLPYQDEQFDKVFTINTIYFWENIEIVLSEIKRVLKKKGVFIIAIRPKSIMDNLPITKFGFNTFSKIDIIKLLAENGLTAIAITEKEDTDLDFFGNRFRNEFLIVKAIKN